MLTALGRRFGTIRWKLTASYLAVTLLATLALEAILFLSAGFFLIRSIIVPKTMVRFSQVLGFAIQSEYEAPDRSITQLQRQLQLISQDNSDENPFVFRLEFPPAPPDLGRSDTPPAWQVPVIALLDQQGRVLTTTLYAYYPQGALLSDLEVPAASGVIQQALHGITATEQISSWSEPGSQPIGVTPIFSRNGNVIGAVYTRIPRPPLVEFFRGLPVVLLASTVPILLMSGAVGLILGLFAGKSFSRRIKRLTQASASLAYGDLSQRVEDGSADEIGQLSRQFNAMAEQLAENVRSLRLLADQNARLAEQAAQLATIEERNRLARDLHDSVSQELFSLTMLAAAAQRLIQQQPATAAIQLGEIQQTAQRALQETRSLIFALRPAMLDNRGLGSALRDLAAATQQRQGLEVCLSISGERRLPLEYEQALFRIVQEALANILKHSHVRAAKVSLCHSNSSVCLTVSDTGCGFDPAAPRNTRSIGLHSMAERATALGGNCSIESTPGRGTAIIVTLPLPEER